MKLFQVSVLILSALHQVKLAVSKEFVDAGSIILHVSNSHKIVKPNQIAARDFSVHKFQSFTKRQLIQGLTNIKEQRIHFVGLQDENSASNAINLPIDTNAFISAAHLAYSNQLSLVITPDIVWHLIARVFAEHLRMKFAGDNTQKAFYVRRDNFTHNPFSNSWNQVIDELSAKIGKLTRENVSELFAGHFSTSTVESTIVSKMALKPSIPSRSWNVSHPEQGIPEIQIRGTKQDWESIVEKTFQLYDQTDPWQVDAERLVEILENFVQVYNNNADPAFWSEFYKVENTEYGPRLSGWIFNFFPRNQYTIEFPMNVHKQPFKWLKSDRLFDMLFISGLVSVRYDPRDASLTPVFGYAIAEDENPAQEGPNVCVHNAFPSIYLAEENEIVAEDEITAVCDAASAFVTSLSNNVKIIRPNELKIESLSIQDFEKKTNKELLQQFIDINDEHIQQVSLEGDSNSGDAFNLPIKTNAFIYAVELAYSHHLPLIITPDIIWYLISSAFAVHINQNAELLRKQFVDFEGKKNITVRRNDFVFNSSANPWNQVIDEFSTKIGEFTKKNASELFTARFSTSTVESTVTSQIVLMDAMQSYLSYATRFSCGIPEIRLSGTKHDWMSIVARARRLFEIMPEMNGWSSTLFEILQNFVSVYDGKADRVFWNEIYKEQVMWKESFVSGWVVGLFPYLRSGVKNDYVWRTHWRQSSQSYNGVATDRFPMSLNKVPFQWLHHSGEHKMLFIGGLLSVRYDLRDHSLTPVFAFAIAADKINPPTSVKYSGPEWYLPGMVITYIEQNETEDE